MTVRIDVAPELLDWAVERSGHSAETVERLFPKLDEWKRGDSRPTLAQLEKFAKRMYTPVGLLLLDEPPIERISIPDFRTFPGADLSEPSANLLDTIYTCQRRQSWYRSFLEDRGDPPLLFVGSLTVGTDPVHAAAAMVQTLGFDLNTRRRFSNWEEALRELSARLEAIGVLVMANGVVGNDTHRKLNPDEFRGFALADTRAPLIFVNNQDSKAAQIFTLAHEASHLWLGQSALTNQSPETPLTANPVEVWCNRVAAEFLVPMATFRMNFERATNLTEEINRLARTFRVSTLVILRRAFDAGFLTRPQYEAANTAEIERIKEVRAGNGGNYYNTAAIRVSKNFQRAIVTDAKEGRTLFRDAYNLLGIKTHSTFERIASDLGVS